MTSEKRKFVTHRVETRETHDSGVRELGRQRFCQLAYKKHNEQPYSRRKTLAGHLNVGNEEKTIGCHNQESSFKAESDDVI